MEQKSGTKTTEFWVALAPVLIGLIEGVLYLTKSQDDFYQTYAVEKKEWF